MIYDIIIVGGGMAGMTACLYSLRNNRKVLLLEKETIGGQIAESPRVENYPTKKSISGAELADEVFEQITDLGAEVEIEDVKKIEKKGKIFYLTTDYSTYECKSVIVATGSRHRHLGLENEEKFIGKGVYYCAICDGPFFKGEDVVLIGDANSALQYAILLSGYCKKVTMVTLFDKFFGEKTLQDSVKKLENVEIIHGAKAVKLNGGDNLESVVFERDDKSTFEIKTRGVFVAIGQVPENEVFSDLADLDKAGYFASDESCTTKTDGLFVAGDCRAKSIRQVTTAMGDAAVASMSANKYLSSLGD